MTEKHGGRQTGSLVKGTQHGATTRPDIVDRIRHGMVSQIRATTNKGSRGGQKQGRGLTLRSETFRSRNEVRLF